MIPNKISLTLFKYGPLRIRFSLGLINDNDFPLYSEFEFRGKFYGNISNIGVINIEVKDNSNTNYDPQRTIMIPYTHYHSLLNAIKDIMNNMYSGKIFYESSTGKLGAYKDEVDKSTVKLQIPNTSSMIVFQPCIVYDDMDISYEAVRIYISRNDIYSEIPIHYMEGLYYVLSKVDYISYTLELMNFVNIYNKKEELISKPVSFNSKISFDEPKEVIKGFKEDNTDMDMMNGL